MNKLIITLLGLFAVTFAQAQCDINRHNTTSDTKWMSCTATQSPNPIRGTSHWLQITLDEFKALGSVYLWNITDPDHLTDGANQVTIDVSTDGSTWTEAADITLAIGDASGFYEGTEVADLDQSIAKYVLITAETNHGGACYGLSELKIEVVNFPCIDDDVTISDDPIPSGVYNAAITLQSDGVVNSEVYLYGEEEVVLLPGFMSDASSVLKVDNQPCSN